MNIKLPSWFKGKPSKVMLTGQDIISLRSDVDQVMSVLNKIVLPDGLTLREDVNDALSATAKAIYKIEALEERMVTAEEKIKLLLK